MSGGLVTLADNEEQLKTKLAKAIESFNRQRVTVLKKAFAEGGDNEVEGLLNEYDALRDAYFELLKGELDRNNHRYVELTVAAKTATEQLQGSIDALDRAAAILEGFNQVIAAVGKMLIVLGV